ncbi:MAG: ferritin family protein [candidate division Zixibacteria bacterium]|nr:ferritin family protein [candidate division Zixibacteria bacterium]
MEIIDFAMKMELDGKKFYEAHAAQAKNPELTKVLLTLAEEEERHYKYFKRLKEGISDLSAADRSAHNDSLNAVRTLFTELSEGTGKKEFADNVLTVWAEALRIEEKTEKYYREKAAIETDPARKQLLNSIADEERSHVYMIDGVLTYLKHPQAFSDSAQFRNFQSWEGH